MAKYFLIFLVVFTSPILAQSTVSDDDALYIKDIHNATLTSNQAFDWLYHLSENIGGRLAGSVAAESAVEYTKSIMDTLGFTKVWKQPCEVVRWNRGEKEQVTVHIGKTFHELNALALGNSIGTSENGIYADVVEVKSLEEVDKLGREGVEGKIVFYNRPMDPTKIRTFNAYGGAVDQRVYGASKAAEYGGLASIVRSMTLAQDDVPHTGTLVYKEDQPKVPGLAISTNDANFLSAQLKEQPVKMYIKTSCTPGDTAQSYNVIGEIKGSEHPEKIILVGGHLDSWDVGGGAHDDGSGCVHALQVIQTLNEIGYRPRHTIRCVMFMNEENGLAGGRTYAEVANEKNEFHLAAIESDSGGFVPRSFSFDGHAENFNDFYAAVSKWTPLFESYGILFETGGSGADIGPLKNQKGLLAGLRTDSQKYFDYHHTDKDRIEAVNKRELQLGAAAMTSLVYLIDKYGLE